MWAIRKIGTHELVTVADEKPPGRDPEKPGRGGGETPWEEQIGPDEEIVELEGSAEDVHAAVAEAAASPFGVGSVILSEALQIMPARTEEDVRAGQKLRIAEEAKGALASHFVNSDDAIGNLAHLLYKSLVSGQSLTQAEIETLTVLEMAYQGGEAKKDEVDATPLEDLDTLDW